MLRIDMNADLGEDCGDDASLMPLITTANVAAGAHAGNPTIMSQTIQQAARHGINVGIHLSYPDRANFGRVSMLDSITGTQLTDTLTEQCFALCLAANTHRVPVTHIKLHGALYNDANQNHELAHAVIRILLTFARSHGRDTFAVFGLPGSALHDVAIEHGLTYVSEAFADRTYQPDGSLTPRSEPNAVLHDTDAVVAQALQIVMDKTVTALTPDGVVRVPVDVQTLCVHGDTPEAVQHAQAIRAAFAENGISVVGFNQP